jgi:AcrR family transcriptional regulator
VTPRSYRMAKRAESVEDTRRRILEASLALHLEKGILATSWQDIAQRADVAVGTVYYHFPTFDELVPACSSLGFELTAPPGPEIFTGLRSTPTRLDKLVRELFAFYERSRKGFELGIRESDRVPALARVADEKRKQFRALVLEALGAGAKKRRVDVVEALVDFPFWLSLTERGIGKEACVKTVLHLIECATERT